MQEKAGGASDIGTAVGGVLGGPVGAVLGNLGGSIISGLFGNKANEDNIRQQERAWARDDSQVQRRVADLMAAGLHPTLAAGGGSTSQPANIQPIIRENPVEQMQQSAQRQLDMTMSKTQQILTKQQVLKEQAATAAQLNQANLIKEQARIEKKKADIFEEVGVIPGQEPGFFGTRWPADWYGNVKDLHKRKLAEAEEKRKRDEAMKKSIKTKVSYFN